MSQVLQVSIKNQGDSQIFYRLTKETTVGNNRIVGID